MTEDEREKVRYIQNRDGITISETHFISQEGAKHHDMPAYWANDKKGSHIHVVKYGKEYYLTQVTMSNYGRPIPYSVSGRDDEQR